MAITTQESVEYAQVYTTVPASNLNTTEKHGRQRVAFFTHEQVGTGDTGSSVALAKLPPGRVRLLLSNSWAYVNWPTAAAKLDLGWDGYTDMAGAAVTADPDGMVDGMDVDTVGIRQFSTSTVAGVIATGYTKLFESKDGVVIRATAQDNAQVTGDDLVGYLTYVVD